MDVNHRILAAEIFFALGEGEDDHRMTARQLALLKASGGQKRKPIMDVDTSSSDEEGSDYAKGRAAQEGRQEEAAGG
ncbi:unnamed protein product [Vitrella brassicaformis CCMP3155]|uniref:Uncharacterized protein n=1 Tax=Vitrella brassicaformis (strain CCMP3155) TaxID=1169540 RepID=A0A0G4GEJ6_VITBC|nr:unnamed protein product [Vitrella brassicaformis CCMP3155]|eukprot:CEM27796.1 unnamed protein product [Vitrella brassicaformis CCMP3155]